MPSARFLGFATASPVAITKAQGAATASGSVPAWASTGGGTVWDGPLNRQTLTVSALEIRPDGAVSAPLAIEWEITVSGSAVGARPADFSLFDPTYTRIQYVVHTGDTGNYRNERVGHASHRNKAFEYGQNPGHVYTNPGTYTGRSIYVYDDQGAWGVASLPNLTVQTPEQVYPPSRTIVVSNTPGETWAGAPPHDVANRCTTLAQAFARFNPASGGAAGVRISVKPGTTYTEAHLTAPTRHFGHGLFDTWGQVGRATITQIGNASSAGGGFFGSDNNGTFGYSVKNWSFNFGFDVFAEAPTNGHGAISSSMNNRSLFTGADKFIWPGNVGFRLCFDNLDVEGCAEAVFNSLVNDEFRRSAYFVNDCRFQRNMDYFLFQGSNFFMLGTEVLEEYGVGLGMMARHRLGGLQRGGKAHRSIRENSNWVIYIRASFMEGRGGWAGQDTVTFYAPQPIFRLDNNGIGKTGRRLYFCDSVFMKGFGLQGGNTGSQVVLENNLIIDDPSNWVDTLNEFGLITGITGGMAVRNNQFLVLNTNRLTEAALAPTRNVAKFDAPGQISVGDSVGRILHISDRAASYGRPLDILHNTVAMLRPAARLTSGAYSLRNTDRDGLYSVVAGHNVEFAPQFSLGPTMNSIDLPPGVRVLDAWMKMFWEIRTFTLASNVAPGQSTPLIPYPNDWYNQPTTQASYAGTKGNHSILTDPTGPSWKAYVALPYAVGNGTGSLPGRFAFSAITVNFQAGGFTITNTSPDTWAAGTISILLDRGTTAMAPDNLVTVNPTEVKAYRPVTPQALTPGVRSTLFDFGRRVRPSTVFAISPAGTNAAGSLLPA